MRLTALVLTIFFLNKKDNEQSDSETGLFESGKCASKLTCVFTACMFLHRIRVLAAGRDSQEKLYLSGLQTTLIQACNDKPFFQGNLAQKHKQMHR